MQLKSPCLDCEHRNENKLGNDTCECCTKRLAYLEQMGAKPVEEEIRFKEFPPKPLPGQAPLWSDQEPKWCDEEGCGELFYAKGKCRKHYDRIRRLGLDKYVSYESGKTITIDFRDVHGGEELNDLIRAISRHEHRSVRNQAMVLLEVGAHKWLEDMQNANR